MPVRMIGKDCWIMLKRLQDRDGEYKTYLFCQSKLRGLPCPRDVKSGKKVYELIPACFEAMSETDFLEKVIYPGLLEPRTGPGSPEQMTVEDLWTRDKEMTEEEKRKRELKRASTHTQ